MISQHKPGVSQSQGGCEELDTWSLTPSLITGSVREQSVSQGLTVSASVALTYLKGKRLLLPPDSNIRSVHHDVEGMVAKVSPSMAVTSWEAWLHLMGPETVWMQAALYCQAQWWCQSVGLTSQRVLYFLKQLLTVTAFLMCPSVF